MLFQTSWGTFCEFDGNPMGPRNFFLKSFPSLSPLPPKREVFSQNYFTKLM